MRIAVGRQVHQRDDNSEKAENVYNKQDNFDPGKLRTSERVDKDAHK